VIEWKLSPDGMEWTVGADDLYLSVFDTGDRIMWDVGVSMRRRSTSEGKAASFDEGKAKAETFAREWVARQAAALGDGWIPVGERLPEDFDAVVIFAKECDGYAYRGLASYDAQYGKWIVNGGSGHGLTVSHWLELPRCLSPR